MKLISENTKGKTYQAEGFKILYRNKGSISGDNDINIEEYMYLVSGIADVTIKQVTVRYTAPASFHIPANTYHKLEAIQDLVIVMREITNDTERQDRKL